MVNKSTLHFTLLVVTLIAIGALHHLTPGDKLVFHETYRRLSYFPIVVGGLLFGVRGGVALALLACIAFIPHLHIFHEMNYDFYLGELTEVALYLAAGTGVGFIASRESRLREKYQILSEKLERSYRRLHEEAALLLEVEEQLRASQKLSALGKLSASLAHEIKNPLASIKGTAEIFLDEFPEGHPKREFVEILLKETARLNATVEEVLNFSRSQHKLGAVEPKKEEVATVLKRVITLLDNAFRKKEIKVELDAAADCHEVFVDADKMAQVFINLLLNASEAVPQGGHIVVRVAREEGSTVISFADDGPGVSENEYEQVFEPFYSEKDEGTGLGLAISAKIIENYGGKITVGRSPLGGALFTVSLSKQEVVYNHG
ncbi:MAG: sensor histidine kinase [Proteobacteria bacterium]|nr:sensor histidine kinase [Pseudomonadota bacterium]MBU1639240.1 sensor histidine kinase [Pseudomonadota bacterium]